jgi:cell fate (sporulation/competence/biofilm development) regulator YlbF (YheA/YmcA/DUF963 family)
MVDTQWNDVEVAPRSVVMETAREFAQALSETPQYREFEQAYLNFRQDTEAQKAIQEFQAKQASLKAMFALNAVSEEDRQELFRLREQFCLKPSFIRFVNAQEALVAYCQNIGDLLSESIGLDFGNSCKTGGCCG